MLNILRLPAVLAATGLSRSTLYDKIARGQFPRPVKLSDRAAGWPDPEVKAWIAARIAERDANKKAA